MAPHNILGIAVASGKLGYVLLDGGALVDWGVSVKATKDSAEVAGFVQGKISDLRPAVVVTEKCDENCRKGNPTRALIRASAETASHNSVLDVSVPRPRRYKTKFEEAEALAKQFPQLSGYLPKQKRRIFDYEPRNMILFEALALAREVQSGGPEKLAAAMG